MGKTGIVVGILLIIVIGVVYFFVSSGKIPNPLSKKSEDPSLGEQIYTQTKNPLEGKLPESNPFSKVNPFKGVYKNPFQ
ncbi:MAG: hypothetical protein G01um10147_235 [Microgenomates group bacterium Gr01-1014_7]|nr:MAG: hypothetical protein G01um10147_235 [Microgenomates group bacterium Gr01-1014_7]